MLAIFILSVQTMTKHVTLLVNKTITHVDGHEIKIDNPNIA